MEPGKDKVLIRKLEAKTHSASGLEIPDSARERPDRGRVEAIGKTVADNAWLVVGDVVIFPKHSGFDVKVNEEDLIIMFEEDIWGRE